MSFEEFENAYIIDCDESLSGVKNSGYRGCQNKTINGYNCQNWESQEPHKHKHISNNYKNSGLTYNYCRNPENKETIWCYTSNPNKKWDYCIPQKPNCSKLDEWNCTFSKTKGKCIWNKDKCYTNKFYNDGNYDGCSKLDTEQCQDDPRCRINQNKGICEKASKYIKHLDEFTNYSYNHNLNYKMLYIIIIFLGIYLIQKIL